jgi:putative oxidoreductase
MLAKYLEPHKETVYAVLRIVAGLLFAFHGIQKVFNVLMPFEVPVGSQAWIGGVIELVTGFAMAAGLFTVWAAFLASGTMAVAYIQFHWKGAMDKNFLPAVNQGELAVIYSFLFLYFACRGPGKWSVDKR